MVVVALHVAGDDVFGGFGGDDVDGTKFDAHEAES